RRREDARVLAGHPRSGEAAALRVQGRHVPPQPSWHDAGAPGERRRIPASGASMRVSRCITLIVLAAAPLVFAACTEEQKPAPKPAPQQTFTMPTGQPGGPPPIIGMNDKPSSIRPGEAPEAPLPGSMNANALAVYQQGLAAFANGDLAAAKIFFKQATDA